MDKIHEVIKALEEMSTDTTITKNVKTKIQATLVALKEDIEISLRVNKALHELDDLTDDINIEPYTRTQLWNVVSMLEMI